MIPVGFKPRRNFVAYALPPIALHIQIVDKWSVVSQRHNSHDTKHCWRIVADQADGQFVAIDKFFHEDRLLIVVAALSDRLG